MPRPPLEVQKVTTIIIVTNTMQVGVLLDFFWSGLVIAPLVVLYWRGTWDLLEDFVSSELKSQQCLVCLLLMFLDPL